ncbi:hypothetical protein F5Y16DRAFT_357117 [Xylariaceae sp. FL0255]|nr:hypothetical protein F5Y16DRAFT_357117 [Xylariaceae sp. FL0255]
MRKINTLEDEELGVLIDKTEALALRSKRTERSRKKQGAKAKKIKDSQLLNLPYELIMRILSLLRPSDVFNLQRTSKPFSIFIDQEATRIARSISSWRYPSMEKSFRLPVLVADIDPAIHPLLLALKRQELLAIHKRPYQHIKPPEQSQVCTCLTCILRWSALCLIVDFAHWQDHLDNGEPIPMVPRGQLVEWNQTLIAVHAQLVCKALDNPLWHARLLEVHLKSTIRSIRRHAANKGNRRDRFLLTRDDADSGVDAFLDRCGPPTLDLPFHRDNYYLLETFMPNRCWSQEQSAWLYLPAQQHDRDVELVVRWAERGKKATLEQKRLEATAAEAISSPQT